MKLFLVRPVNKFNAKKVTIDDTIFDSEFEASIYRTLKKVVSYSDTGITLLIKPGVIIKPKCDVFPERKWKCDFRLEHLEWGAINIEAKGFPTNDFTIVLEMLEACNPLEFDRTVLIPLSEDVWKKYKRLKAVDQIWGIAEMKERILDRKYWEKLNG
jgi:hypothetical protein